MIENFDVDVVAVGKRRRHLSKDRVKILAESIKEIGLQSPITVFCADNDTSTPPQLVAGLHRLKAFEMLGLEEIPCLITTAEELDRQLWEIDENLCRSDLTKLERAEHLKARKEIFDAKVGSVGPGGRGNKGFDQQTAEAIGSTKKRVRQARVRAEKIIPEVKERIAGSEIADSGIDLDALSNLPAQQQSDAIDLIEGGTCKSVRDAAEFITGQSAEEIEIQKQFESIRRAWKKAKEPARNKFLEWLDQ